MTRSSSRLQHSRSLALSSARLTDTRPNLLSKQVARRNTRVSKIRSPDRSPPRKANDEVLPLQTMNVPHFHYAHRESARMTVNLREWRSPPFGGGGCTPLPLGASWASENGRESARMTVNSWPFCSGSQSTSEPATTAVNCRPPPSSLRHMSIADLLALRASQPVNSRPSPCPSASTGLYNNYFLKRWDTAW